MIDGAAGELGKDNRVLTLAAEETRSRSAEDAQLQTRSKIQPQLALSRSSTDEAQLESGNISRVAFLMPKRKTRRRVSKTLPTGADTHTDGSARRRATETSRFHQTQAAGPRKSTRASSTASRSTAAASGSASPSTSARAR